jgi:hypothetical protein
VFRGVTVNDKRLTFEMIALAQIIIDKKTTVCYIIPPYLIFQKGFITPKRKTKAGI